jgi:hypothetical protein
VTVAVGGGVASLRRVSGEAAGDRERAGIGTIGFLALRNGRRQRELVLVSNRHVLLAHGAGRGDPVYSPVPAGRPGAWTLSIVDPVGIILDEGAEDNHAFRYPGEPVCEYYVDCACARVAPDHAMPIAPSVRGTARLHWLDVAGTRTVRVRKIGALTGVTAGRVVDARARVEVAGRPGRLNNLVIRGIDRPFAEPGDSGALVVNERYEAIGMVWGTSERDPAIAYASHIHPVLDRLGVTMLTRRFP